VPQLPLDDHHRHAFVREFDRVRMAQLMIVPTSAQASLRRHDRYAEAGENSLLRSVRALRKSAYSELLEKAQERVGGLIAPGLGRERRGAVDRLLLVGHVGVEVDVGG